MAPCNYKLFSFADYRIDFTVIQFTLLALTNILAIAVGVEKVVKYHIFYDDVKKQSIKSTYPMIFML